MARSDPNQREAVILQILSNGEQYGLEIRDSYRLATRRDIKLGTLYPLLENMCEKRFLASRYGESNPDRGGNRRRYFRLTAEGRRALTQAHSMAKAILGDWPTVVNHGVELRAS